MLNSHNEINLPLVSIIIPCFNSEEYISECVESALSQDYSNIEVIVVNDGSTDNSVNILKKIKGINLYTQKNSGACVARNFGLSKSKGKYIKFLDSDDFLAPHAISTQVKISETLSPYTIVYGDYYELRDGTATYQSLYKPYTNQTSNLIMSYILTTSPLHRRWMLEKIGGFDERFKNGQEWNLHIRLSSEGFIFHHHKLPIHTYRIHHSPDRISVQKNNDTNKLLYAASKAEMTLEKIANNYSGDVNAAFAYRFWNIARQLYLAGDRENYKIYLHKSKALTPDYQKFWTKKRQLLHKALGFELSTRVSKIYSKLRKSSDKFI